MVSLTAEAQYVIRLVTKIISGFLLRAFKSSINQLTGIPYLEKFLFTSSKPAGSSIVVFMYGPRPFLKAGLTGFAFL